MNASEGPSPRADRKSTRLNSGHLVISYAVFCLKKKKKIDERAEEVEDGVEATILDLQLAEVRLDPPWIVCISGVPPRIFLFHVFFFNDTATTEIYTLSLHDALPIFAATFGTCGSPWDTTTSAAPMMPA